MMSSSSSMEAKPLLPSHNDKFHSDNRRLNSSLLQSKDIIKDELYHTTELALPVIGTYCLEFAPGIVSVMLVGHIESELTEEYIDAASLAVMFVNLTGLSIGFGLATAMDTLGSQAFGAGKPKQLGTYFQTGVIVLAIAFIPVFFTNFYCTRILLGLHQPALVSELAGKFSRWMLPGIPFLYIYELFKKVLQAQNIAKPMLFVAIISNVLNFVIGYVLVYHTSMGFIGAAVARTICNVSYPLLLLPYLIKSGMLYTFWDGLKIPSAVAGISEFLRLGVSGMLMMCFEWWAFEIIALISGWLPNAVQAIGANAVLLNISAMTFMFYLGLSVSGNVRIGNALGAGDYKRAQVSSGLVQILSVTLACVLALAMLLFRTSIPALFTKDAAIDALTCQLLYVSSFFQVWDAMNAAVQGSFRGCGRQALGAKLNFLAYYVVGIPFGSVLAYHFGMGIIGLWLGMTAGLMAISVTGVAILCRTNWKALAAEAQDRVVLTSSS